MSRRMTKSESSLCALRTVKDLRLLHADSEDSGQTGRMPRMICVFAGRTGHYIGFVMLRLICLLSGVFVAELEFSIRLKSG